MLGDEVTITTDANELKEGLFGQIFLYVFEILPYSDRLKARPNWAIHARRYGGDAQTVIPGVLDLAYEPAFGSRKVSLSALRDKHCFQLGNYW